MIKSGYSFLDDNIGGFNAGELIMIKGVTKQTEEFTVSLLQCVLEHNDGYALLFNTPDFHLFTSTIFDDPADDADKLIIGSRLDKMRILKRDLTAVEADILQKSLVFWLETKKYKHLKREKLSIIFTTLPKQWATREKAFVGKLKKLAHAMSVPVVYMQDISQKDYAAADIVIELKSVNGYKKPVEVSVLRTPRGTIQTAVADEGNLKYSVGLENCTKLWFYEE